MALIVGTALGDTIRPIEEGGSTGGLPPATSGADEIYGLGGNDLLSGGGGNDTLDGGTGADTLLGGDGDDLLFSDDDGATDRLFGGAGADTLVGRGHNDFLSGGAGNDLFVLAAPRDAGTKSVVIQDFVAGPGGEVADVSFLGIGDFATLLEIGYNNGPGQWDLRAWLGSTNTTYRFLGVQEAALVAANFRLSDITTDDLILGTGGNDDLFGGLGADTLQGGAGHDRLFGEQGDDVLEGGEGRDTLYGGDGDDLLSTEDDGDADVAFGGAGADTIIGRGHADYLHGGEGNDVFVLAAPRNAGTKTVTIVDFVPGEGGEVADLRFLGIGEFATILQLGNDGGGFWQLLAVLGSQTTAYRFLGVAESQLVAANFRFAEEATDELIIGTAGNDDLFGGPGADTLEGGGGNDRLFGEQGDDVLDGGAGADTLFGGDGDDLIFTGDDSALDHAFGGAGADTLVGQGHGDYLHGGDGNDVFVLAAPRNAGSKNVYIEDFVAGPGGEIVDVTFLGISEFATILELGADFASYWRIPVWLGSQTTTYYFADQQEAAFVASNFRFSLDATDDLIFGTAGIDDLFGGLGADTLLGDAGNDRLFGEDGDDVLDGGPGADTLFGGLGNDLYILDSLADRVIDTGGADTIAAPFNVTLQAGIEGLLLLGGLALRGTGNGLDNILVGNSGPNLLVGGGGRDSLRGEEGADTLNGGAGADTMAGGPGADRYIVDSPGDVLIEFEGEGNDQVVSSISWTLGAHFEGLQLTGTADLAGTGNELANRVAGNAGNNLLVGLDGNDALVGLDGADTLIGGPGRDVLNGGAGADMFVLSSPSAADGPDKIVDFSPGEDIIALIAAGFGAGLLPGALDPAHFVAHASNQAASPAGTPQVIYNTLNGGLLFDPDGPGGVPVAKIAVVLGVPALTATDIILI